MDRGHALSERQTSIDFTGVACKLPRAFYGHGDGELAAFTRPMIAAVSVGSAACPNRSPILVARSVASLATSSAAMASPAAS